MSNIRWVACVLALAMTAAQAAPHPVIGLLTDYGWNDPYVAQIKGVIVTVDPAARILDLTHAVTPFNVVEGSYLLDQSAAEFPAGSIFVAVVDPQVGTSRDPVLLQTGKGKYYVGPDNGLFSDVIAREGFGKAWKLDRAQFFRSNDISHTFHGRDIFAPVAAHLAAGSDPERMGTPLKTLIMLPNHEAAFAGGLITAHVVHVDHFGNVVLNLPANGEAAAKLKEGNLVKITVNHETLSGPFVKTYAEVEKGRLLLLFGGSGLLEIAMSQGSAAQKVRAQPGTDVILKP